MTHIHPPLFVSLKNEEDKVPESFRQIELWTQQATVAAGSGGYASLTGPGQTTTPGALTQAGDLTVNAQSQIALDATNAGNTVVIQGGDTNSIITLGDTGVGVHIFTGDGAGINIATNTTTGPIVIGTTANGNILITSTGNVAIQTTALGFFTTTPIAQQSGAGITTVAQVVTALRNYGLLS